MEDLLNRIAQAQRAQKLALLGVLIVALCGGYYYFFYGDLLDEQAQNAEVIKKARKEEDEYKKRVEQYKAYVLERNQLRDEQRELLRILPQNDDLDQFLQSVNAQVEACGLVKFSTVREEPKREEIYERLPVRMSLQGSFHQIMKFFKSVGEMERIVTISDLQLGPADGRGPTQNGPLKADFVAQTFRLAQAAPNPPPAPGAHPAPAPPHGGAK